MRKYGLQGRAGILALLLSWPVGGGLTASMAADAVAIGRMALQDGFYRLADETLQQVLARDENEPAELASAADYILHAHFEQRHLERLEADLARFTQAGVLDEGAAVCWRALLREAAADREGMLEVLSWFETEEGLRSAYAPRGLRLKALAHFKDDDPDRSAAVFAQLDRVQTHTPARYYNRMDWGLVLLSGASPAAAQAVWAPLASETNVPPLLAADVRYWMAQAHLETGAVAQAEALLQPLSTDTGLDERRRIQAVFALAEARRLAADAAGGIALLTRLTETVANPDWRRQIEHKLAVHLLEKGDLDEATRKIRSYAGMYAADPESALLLRRLGYALLAADRHAEADGVFQQALEAFGDQDGDVHHGRALALAGLGRDAEAALVFERAAASGGHLAADSLFRAGDRYYAAGQYRKALDAYDRFLRVPGAGSDAGMIPRAWFQRGASLAALNETDAAVAVFELLATDYPDSPEAANALLSIGDLHLQPGRYESAVAAFERVMAAYPGGTTYWRALHGRGTARFHLWIPEALDDFERLATVADTALAEHSRFMQAMCLYRLGRDEQALRLCREFRTDAPDSEWAPPVHFWIARFEYNAGNFERAGQEFLSFVETYPDHELAPQGLLRAGLAAARRQQYLTAIELFGRMAKQYPQGGMLAESRFYQAEAMVQLGRFAAAILGYEEVINSTGDRELAAMAWGRKGDCQFTLGADDPARYEEAVQSYLAVLKMPGIRLDHSLQAAYKLGLTYEKLQRMEEALELYYSKVMLPFLLEQEKGGIPGESARTWFSRAARGAADIVEGRKDWRRLVRILERAAAADVEFSAEARTRMWAVKSEYWWLFY